MVGGPAEVEAFVEWMKTLKLAARRQVEAAIGAATPHFKPSREQRQRVRSRELGRARAPGPARRDDRLAHHDASHPHLAHAAGDRGRAARKPPRAGEAARPARSRSFATRTATSTRPWSRTRGAITARPSRWIRAPSTATPTRIACRATPCTPSARGAWCAAWFSANWGLTPFICEWRRSARRAATCRATGRR